MFPRELRTTDHTNERPAEPNSSHCVSTDVCLTLPAVSAVRDGYEVYGVVDASGTFSQHALMASMFRMSQAGVVIANATMLVSELLADWSSK
jgi:hypothetical protein